MGRPAEPVKIRKLPKPTKLRRYQMRGGAGPGPVFLASLDDYEKYTALPWYKKFGGFERYMKKQRGNSIYD